MFAILHLGGHDHTNDFTPPAPFATTSRVARVALSEQGSRQYAFEPVHECLLLDKDNLTKITLIPDQPEHLETITHNRYQHVTHGSFPCSPSLQSDQ